MYKILIVALLLISLNSELVQVATIFRHGSRYPVHSTYDGNQTKADWGELTSTGMRQHYNLGSMVRKQYITDNPFLMKSYNHSEIEVQCTDYNRTHMSAFSFLFGLYPQETGPKVPANINKSCLIPPYEGMTQDYSDKAFTLPHGRQIINFKEDWGSIFIDCQKQQAINLQKNKLSIQELEQKYEPFLKQMSTTFKTDVPLTILGVSRLFDTIVCDKFLNRAMPAAFNDSSYINLRHLHYVANQYRYEADFANAVNTPKFRRIFSNFDKAVSKTNGLFKMSIFSCHDTDLIPLQSQLNISSASCIEQLYRFNKTNSLNCEPGPQFASSIILELHRNGSQHNIMIKSDGKYINLCQNKSTSCPYEQFKRRIVKDYKNQKETC